MKWIYHLAAAIAIFKLIHFKFTACAALLHSLPALAASHWYCKLKETSVLDVRLVSNSRDSPTVSQRVGSSLTQSTDKLTASLIQSESLTAMIFMLHFQQCERLSKILKENITEVQGKVMSFLKYRKIERVIILYDFRQCIKFNLPPAAFKSNFHQI